MVDARIVEGKPLSYNNILDAGAALELVTDLRALQVAAAALKARIAARVATLTVLRDAMRAVDRQGRGAIGIYDAAGRRNGR